jgi:DNA-binding response OmpR family regulator
MKKRILVIEDGHAIRHEVLTTLQFAGYEALEAPDGAAGLELARRELPDLILCDVTMPQLDGYSTLQALQREEDTAAIPFIFLTARADRPDVRHGMELGADDYLVKPFTAQELLRAVSVRLGRQAATRERSEKKLNELRTSVSLALPHELRTPLSAILSAAEILADEEVQHEPAHVRHWARTISSAAERLHRLTENFLVFAQLELLDAQPDRIDGLRSLTASGPMAVIEAACRRVAEAHGRLRDLQVNIGLEAALSLPTGHLHKIVEELVDNAFKFSVAGDPVAVVADRSAHSLLLQIGDHGRGMTPAQIASVGGYVQFLRQVHEQQGTGLGLAIAQRLARLYGGDLTIESQPGRTWVRVSLPTAPGGT